MFAIGVTILVMFGGLGLMISEQVNAQYIPVASLTFDESIKSVDVSPGSDGVTVFNGTLYVECDYPTITEFNITGSAGTGNWTMVISPATISLSAGTHEVPVNFTVIVPLGTSADIAGAVHIDGTTRTATPISYVCDFANQVIVTVNPYYMFSVSSPEPYKEIIPGGNATFSISITNKGNTMIDDLHVDVDNKDELDNWTVIVPSSSLTVDEKSTINVSINILTPEEECFGTTKKITINASSQIANLSETYSVYIRLVHLIKNFSPLENPTIDETEDVDFSAILPDVQDIVINWCLDGKILTDEINTTYSFFSDYDSAGTYNVTVIVSSGTLTENHTWILNVINVNRKPMLEPINNQTAYEGQIFTLQINAFNPDNVTVIFSDNTTLFSINTTTGLIQFTPNYESAGMYYISITLYGGADIDYQAFKLTIVDVNRKPTAIISSPSNNAKFTTNDDISFDASDSSDPDNDSLTYNWTSNIDGDIGNTATFSKKLSSGTHTITLTIDDENGGTDTEQITITVNKPSEKKGLIPGFEILSLLSALCICILLLKRKH